MPFTSTQRHRVIMYGLLAAQVLVFGFTAPWMLLPGTATKVVPTVGIIVVLVCLALPTPPSSLRRTVLYAGYVTVVFGNNIIAALNYTGTVDENVSSTPVLDATTLTIFQCLLALGCYFIASTWNRQWHNHMHADAPERPRSETDVNPRPGIRHDLLRIAPLMFAGMFTATITQHVVLDSLDASLLNSHNFATVHGWIGGLISGATAGVKEEPIFVGLAVALWPTLTLRRLLGIVALTTLARTTIHLYYAHGPAVEHVDTIAGVILWCAIWSTTNLLIVYYRPSLLWAVVAGHGVYNIALALLGGPDALPAHGIYQATGSVLFWALSAAGVIAAGCLLARTEIGAVLTRELRRVLPVEHIRQRASTPIQGPPSPRRG